MKLKMIKKIVTYNKKLSPNFSVRIKKIKYVIIHYTGTSSVSEALNIFKDKKSRVSCHWLITNRGMLYKVVDEKYTAWHAGVSFWKKEKMLNDSSIGIELDNIGHGLGYRSFPDKQIKVLELLLEKIIREYKIKKQNVLAHSDIAPNRKLDPGELFNWSRLAKKNLAYFPETKNYSKKNIFLKLGDNSSKIGLIKIKLNDIGYKCSKNNNFDIYLKLVVEAFQRRFLPEKINGIIDGKVYSRILEVSKNA